MSYTQAVNYALSIKQCAQLIATIGKFNTVLVQGEMGIGKTAILWVLAKMFPDHLPIYFDGTTKDVGDMAIPMFASIGEDGVVRYATNEELGLHLGKPVILMIDEFGKCLPSVKNALAQLILERSLFGKKLHEDSFVFATTNLAVEGLGDLLPAHIRNRITTVTMRKSDNMEAIEYGIEHNFEPALLAWYKDTPQLFHSFQDYNSPNENPYINDPRDPSRIACFTPRSGEKANNILKQRDFIDDATLTASLMGTIGARGALDLMAYVQLSDQMPSPEDIKTDPTNAKIPTSPGAVCMVVYRALSIMDRESIKPWMVYLNRLPKEVQGLFVNGVRVKDYSKRDIVVTTKEYQEWCLANNYAISVNN